MNQQKPKTLEARGRPDDLPIDEDKILQNFFENQPGGDDWRRQAELFATTIGFVATANLPAQIHPLDLKTFKMSIRSVRENYEALGDLLDANQSNRTSEAYKHLRRLMAGMFMLGQSAVMSPKMKEIFLSEFQAEKGHASATAKRKKAAAWQKPVLEFAIALRTKNKRLTQSDLATKILEKWNQIDFGGKREPPKNHTYLMQRISKWEKAGTLPFYTLALV